MASRWKLVATALDGTVQGEVLDCANRSTQLQHNGATTGGFRIKLENPRADFLLSTDALIKVYRQPVAGGNFALLGVCDVINATEVAQGDVAFVDVAYADPLWRLMLRLIGKTVDGNGKGVGFAYGTAGAQVDRGLIATAILTAINGDFYTGVAVGSVVTTTNSYAGPWYMKKAGEAIVELANVLNGYDFELAPVEPTGAWPSTQIATLNLYGARGGAKPKAIFEYGTGKRNVVGYTRTFDRSGLNNKAYALPQGWPDAVVSTDPLVTSSDATSISARGLYEDTTSGDVTNFTLRQALADEQVGIRKAPRQQINFQPIVNCPTDFGTDYVIGDTVTARAWVEERKSWRFNGSARVYGVGFAPDDNDNEQITLALVPGG